MHYNNSITDHKKSSESWNMPLILQVAAEDRSPGDAASGHSTTP